MKAFLGRLVAIGFGLLFAVILIESLGRWMNLLPIVLDDAYFDVRDSVGVYPEPHSYFWWQNPDTNERIWIQFNSASRRDIEHPYAKPQDTTRIMFLGDSYTSAWQHPIDESYVARMRSWVDEDVQLLNAGFHGWGTDRQYLYYREDGHRYDSDVVVLQIYIGNDVIDNGVGVLEDTALDDERLVISYDQPSTRPYFIFDDTDSLEFVPPNDFAPTRSERVGGIRSFLRTYSMTYSLLEQLIVSFAPSDSSVASFDDVQDRAPVEIPIDYYAYSPESQQRDDWMQAWHITEQLLLMLRDEVEGHGGQLVVLLVDTRWQHDREGYQAFLADWDIPEAWTGEQLGERMQAILDEHNIPYLVPLSALLDFEDQTGISINLRLDGHWTDAGHCVVATELNNWLVDLAILPETTERQSALSTCQ